MQKYCTHCMQPLEGGAVCPHCGKTSSRKLPHLLLQGTILKERYLIGDAIGQGGFGITYIGRDLLLDLRVAVKEYYPGGYVSRNNAASPEVTTSTREQAELLKSGREKFLQEARVLAAFHEEAGIVDVRDFFEENNTAYIVMEYLDGVTLLQFLKLKCLTPDLAIRMMDPIMAALEKIHARHVIHRDISPDNIMVLKSGNLKLMDFGAARQAEGGELKSTSVILKAGFTPPEQYRCKGELGPWTDVYALCATIYMCVTGRRPEDSLERTIADEIQWPGEMGIPISDAAEQALRKGMSLDWRDRYQTIGDLRKAFALPENVRIGSEPDSIPLFSDLGYETDPGGVRDLVCTAVEENRREDAASQQKDLIDARRAVAAEDTGRNESEAAPAEPEGKKSVEAPAELEGERSEAAPAEPAETKDRNECENRVKTADSGHLKKKVPAKAGAPKKKRILGVAVVLLFLCTVPGIFITFGRLGTGGAVSDRRQTMPSGMLTGYALEEVGTFEDPAAGTTGTITVHEDKLVIAHDDKSFQAVTEEGQMINPARYEYLKELRPAGGSDRSGYFVVIESGKGDENNKGLIDNDGNVLIPCQALRIDRVGYHPNSDRYLAIYYSTGETIESEDYLTKETTRGIVHYYNGYVRIYDLYNKTFISDLKVSRDKAVHACGESLIVEDPAGTYTVYDSSGGQILQTHETILVGKDFFIIRSDGIYYVYDEQGNVLFSLSDGIAPLDENSSYILQRTSEGYMILDRSGKQVFPASFRHVSQEHEDIFEVAGKRKELQLIDRNGNVLYSSDRSLVWLTGFYWYCDSRHILVDPCGKSPRLIDGKNLTYSNGKSDFYVLNDRKYSLHMQSNQVSSLTYAMISAKESSGKYMVYDLFTGSKLLPFESARVLYASGYIYALDGSTWHVFKVNCIYS